MTDQAAPEGYTASGSHALPGVLAEFTLGPDYRRPALLRFVLNFAGTGLLGVIGLKVAPIGYVLGSVTAVSAGGYGIAYLWRGRFRTRVTTRGIEARGYFNHFVPWNQVRGIETGGYLSAGFQPLPGVYRRAGMAGTAGRGMAARSGRMARLATVKVVRTDGRKLMLRAPLVTGWASDSYFNDKARQLQQIARQHAGLPPAG